MFENPRRGRQARNFTTNVPKILDLKSSSKQIFSEDWRWVPLHGVINKTSDLMRSTYPLPSILIAFTSQSQKPILNQNTKSPKANQEKSRVTLHKSCKRKVPHMSNENQSKGKVRKLDNIMDVFFSPEKRLKLSLALNEINRRLAGQILIWKMLPCETG